MHVCAPQGKAGCETAKCQGPQPPWNSGAQHLALLGPGTAAQKEMIRSWGIGTGTDTAEEHDSWLTEASARPESAKGLDSGSS